MQKNKKSQMVNYKFESSYQLGGKFVKICGDMMNTMAWQKLTMRERGLYLELKKKFTKNKQGETNQDDISIVHSNYKREYKSKNTLMNDVDNLINNGFIKVLRHGKFSRLPNIYGFTDMWKNYNTDKFFIHPNHKRLTNKNKKYLH